MIERTLCECGKWMIKRSTGFAYMTYPPQYPMEWWCACGKTKSAETIRGKTNEELNKEQWDKANEQEL